METVIGILASIILTLAGLGYHDIARRLSSVERKQSATLVALMFAVMHLKDPVPTEVITALQEAMINGS